MSYSANQAALLEEQHSATGRKYILESEDLENQQYEGRLMLHAFYFTYGQQHYAKTYPGVSNKPVKLSDRSMFWILLNKEIEGGYSNDELCKLFPEDFGPDGLPLEDRESDGPGEEACIKIGDKIYKFPGLPSEAEKNKMHLKQALVLDQLLYQQNLPNDTLRFRDEEVFGSAAYKRDTEELREEIKELKKQINDLNITYQKQITDLSTAELSRLRAWAQKLRDREVGLGKRERVLQEKEDEICSAISIQKPADALPVSPADHNICDQKLEEARRKKGETLQSLAVAERSLTKLRSAFEIIELGLPSVKSTLAEVDGDMKAHMDPKLFMEFEMVQKKVAARALRMFDSTMRKVPGGARIERNSPYETEDVLSAQVTSSRMSKVASDAELLNKGKFIPSNNLTDSSNDVEPARATPVLEPIYMGSHISRHIISNAKEWTEEVRRSRE